MSEQTPKPYHRDENGWVWCGSLMVYPFSTSTSFLDALNFAYGHGYEDAMTRAASRPAPDVDAIAREAADQISVHGVRSWINGPMVILYDEVAAIIREAIEKATGHA